MKDAQDSAIALGNIKRKTARCIRDDSEQKLLTEYDNNHGLLARKRSKCGLIVVKRKQEQRDAITDRQTDTPETLQKRNPRLTANRSS